MKRNLDTWYETGKALLRQHERYDLTHSEVVELFEAAGVDKGSASAAYDVMNRAFAIGIEAGRRIQKREAER